MVVERNHAGADELIYGEAVMCSFLKSLNVVVPESSGSAVEFFGIE